MVIPKFKKGSGEGVTAFLLLGLCILAFQLTFFALMERGIIIIEDWFVRSIVSTLVTFGAALVYYLIAHNLVSQGKNKQKYMEFAQ